MGLLDDAIREHLELKRRHGADPAEVARLEQEALGPARRTPEPLQPPAAAAEERRYAGAVAYDEGVDAPAGYGEPEGYGDDVEQHASAADRGAEIREPHAALEHEDEARYEGELEDEPAPQSAAGSVELEEDEPPLPPQDRQVTDDGPSQPTAAFEVDDLHEAMRPPSGARAMSEEEERGAEPEPEVAAEPPAAPAPPVEPRKPEQPREPGDRGPGASSPRGRHGSEAAPEGQAADHGDDVLEETPDFLQETPEHDRLWFEQRPPRDFDF